MHSYWRHEPVRGPAKLRDLYCAVLGDDWHKLCPALSQWEGRAPGAVRLTHAEAPFPITATRFPHKSTSASHFAEWNILPLNNASPGISGNRGTSRIPRAEIRIFAVVDDLRPAAFSVTTWYSCSLAFHSADTTRQLKEMWRYKSYLRVSFIQYACVSNCEPCVDGQSGVRSVDRQ